MEGSGRSGQRGERSQKNGYVKLSFEPHCYPHRWRQSVGLLEINPSTSGSSAARFGILALAGADSQIYFASETGMGPNCCRSEIRAIRDKETSRPSSEVPVPTSMAIVIFEGMGMLVWRRLTAILVNPPIIQKPIVHFDQRECVRFRDEARVESARFGGR